ncbi:MarR family winged helix-turn-helix transcriptional regulator [Nocardia alni]|uniref:MarR family winged helix-turn-helix transcriptional regulator n=1 Tax=Nocardia alni TaxID=2815723 RepID=UPI001C216F78|nr:MarR family transcriptional regulator [Nocardia alni]
MTAPGPRDTAAQLANAMARLRARLRTESERADMPWSWAQLTTLSRILKEGPTTTSALAAAEHVRPQSMAETVTALLRHGLVTRESDPADGRKSPIAATDQGRALIQSIPAMRETWLTSAIDRELSAAERRTLAKAAQIMERLADS